jgi:(p)ppGpp synthase/HD superfamily hydrolase
MIKNKLVSFLSSFNAERKRRISSSTTFDKKALLEWNNVINSKKLKNNKTQLLNYFNYSKNIKYLHHQNKSYFSHPLRVANMAFNFSKYSKSPKNLVILALLHNIVETSNYSTNYLNKFLGKFITKQIKVLTVNRKKQWNKNYKEKYYQAINSHHKNTRIIKIIDKLDNLFIIGSCKSDLTRKRYIAEIEDYILPMVKKDIPILSKYFYGLIIQSYELGYYGNKKN